MPKSKEVVEYNDKTHTYLINGVIVPSVSELCSYATGNKYAKVNEYYKKRAQEYGTLVHSCIEIYEDTKDVGETLNRLSSKINELISEYGDYFSNKLFIEILEKYKELKKDWFLEVEKKEERLHYKTLYAGRLDCIDQMGKIWDWKTNSKESIEYWSWQTGYYYLGAKYSGLIKEIQSEAHIMWLPKKNLDKAKVITVVPKSESELLENYNKWKKEKDEISNSKRL